MKQFSFFLSLLFCANVFATVRTVSNNPSTLAQYNTIQAAVTAASSGDTIYVQGSLTRYAGFTVADKRLTIIGPGWAPLQNFMAFDATVDGCTITGNSKNSEIQGLHFSLSVTINTHDSVRLIRNQFETAVYFASVGTYTNILFQDNFFLEGWISAGNGIILTNSVFQNNIFYATYSNGNIASLPSSQSVLFDHNLWYGPTGTSVAPCFGGGVQNLLFTNNIFVHRNPATNVTNSVFNKNITYGSGVNNPWDPSYQNSGSGNVADQDPQMFHQDSVNAGKKNPLLNFTIAGGPANNAGTDGKDLGLLFDASGILNWTNSRMSRLPFIYSMDLSNPNVAPGATLNVQVEARRNN